MTNLLGGETSSMGQVSTNSYFSTYQGIGVQAPTVISNRQIFEIHSFTKPSKIKDPVFGWGCGYVIIPYNHPYFFKDIDFFNGFLVPGKSVSFLMLGSDIPYSWVEMPITFRNANYKVLGFHSAKYDNFDSNVYNSTQVEIQLAVWKNRLKEV